MTPKIIINFCPTGMVPTKEMTPHVPISPEEIIEQTHEAFELGITIVHLHARDSDGSPTSQAAVYAKIFDGVRKHCPGLIICGSTSGRSRSEFEARSEVIELHPDMCSLTLSSLNFSKHPSINAPDTIIRLAEKMSHYGVVPELECFDLGMVNYGHYLLRKELLEGPCYWNLLFGNIAGWQAKAGHVAAATAEIPAGHHVSLGGLGHAQLTVSGLAIAFGYGLRVGLEDNIWMDRDRTCLATNIGLLQRVHQLLKIHETGYLPPPELGQRGFYNRKLAFRGSGSLIRAFD